MYGIKKKKKKSFSVKVFFKRTPSLPLSRPEQCYPQFPHGKDRNRNQESGDETSGSGCREVSQLVISTQKKD